MTLDLDALKRIATAATQPGPWSTMTTDGETTVVDADGMWVAECGAAPLDAAHIAAFSPDLALELIAEIELLTQLRADNIKLREDLDHATADDGDWLSKESRRMCETVLGDRDAAREKAGTLKRLLAETCSIGERLAGLECSSADEDRIAEIRREGGIK